MSKKSDSQKIFSKFIEIGVLILYPNYYPKPEVQNPKPEMKVYEKPDPTRYPNTQTRPDPKPEKVLPATPLVTENSNETFLVIFNNCDMFSKES